MERRQRAGPDHPCRKVWKLKEKAVGGEEEGKEEGKEKAEEQG